MKKFIFLFITTSVFCAEQGVSVGIGVGHQVVQGNAVVHQHFISPAPSERNFIVSYIPPLPFFLESGSESMGSSYIRP